MLSGLLPCIAVAARPAFQTSEELLASILQAGGNVGATCLTGEGRVLFGQDMRGASSVGRRCFHPALGLRLTQGWSVCRGR